MGKFVIKKRVNNEYQFNLEASNGRVILTSEGYSSKSACKNGIDSVKVHSPYDENYDRRISSNWKYYFNLKAKNGQIIGTSEMYESTSGRDNGIESVKSNAPTADVEDNT
ncbi:MAG: YegP family protein [Flavobacteriales bacterium]|nr:YegP family protein [Flavobacteriales bacterium]